MTFAWYSLVAPAPDGFEYHDSLSRAELRGGPFAVFAADLSSVRTILLGLEDKVTGLVITWEEQFAWKPLGRTLFHLGLPPGLRPHLADLLPAYLDLTGALRAELDVDRALHLEMGRALEDRRRLAADHERARKALLSDISERRQVETALRESEEKFHSVFETISDVISITRLRDGMVVDLNPAIEEISGCPRQQFIGRSSIEMKSWANPADRDRMVKAVLEQGSIRNMEARLNSGSGQLRDCLVSAHLMRLQDEPHILTVFKDITERKRVEEALHQSEATFRKLFSDSSDAILLIDNAGVFVECNQAALDLLKMTREQFLLLPPARISPEFQPDGRRSAESAPEMIALAYSKGLHRFDWTCVNAEGGEFIVEVSLMPIVINGQTMLHTTWRDITERKRVEENLRESESRYRRLHESMTDAFAQVDMAGTIVEVNRAFETMLGYPAKELRQLSYRDITPERWHAEEARILAEQVIPRGYSEIYEKECRRKDGRVIAVELRTYLLTDDHRQPVGMWAILRDISERKAFLEALQQSEARFRMIFESSPDPLIIARIDGGGILAVNRAFELSTGIPAEEAIGKNGLDLNLWAETSERDEFLQQLGRNGAVANLETRFRMQNGEIRVGLTSAQTIFTEEGPCMLIAIRDITRQKQAETVLMEMDRMKSEFISTAAHELRTPLAVILGYTELLQSPEDFGGFPEERKAEFFREILLKCEALSLIIDEMLDISRIESGLPIALDLQPHAPATWITRILQRFELQGSRHALVLDLDGPQPETLICDLHRITQVLENLLSNATKYSPPGRSITIRGTKLGENYVVEVHDQGIGMTEEQVARVFDKFWRADSSNTAISGLGLGMSIARQIVEAHGGRIWVESTPGKGTTARFALPLNR